VHQPLALRNFIFHVIIGLLTTVISSSYAQEIKKIDSLKSALKSQLPSERYGTLLELGIAYADSDNKVSLDFISDAYAVAVSLGDTAKIVRSARIKGQLLRRLDRLDEAMTILTTMLPIAKRNNLLSDYKVILNSLALTHSDRANYDKALEYHFESLLIREAEGNKADVSIALNNIGLVYYKLTNYDKAIDYYHRALQLKKESNDNYGIDVTLVNIGHCYNALRLYDKAQEYFYQGLKECGENCPANVRADAEYGLGMSFFNQQKLDKAKGRFNNAYKLAKTNNNKRFQSENLVMLGQIAIQEGEYSFAVELLKSAEKLAEESGYNKLLIETYRQFATLYNQQQNFEQAAFFQGKYIQLKDSIFSDGLIKNLATVQTRFEERENIRTIARRDSALSRQRQFIISVIIIAILAGLLIFMLFRSNAAKRKANERLDREVQAATKDLEVANTLLAEVNKELDHFIYKTSHDIRGPLASLKGLCNVALTDVKDAVARDYFIKLDSTASRLDTLLRRLQKINQINHASIKPEPINFEKVVNQLVEGASELPSRLTIKRDIQAGINFSSDKELIYLVLENLMDNAVKFHDSLKDPFVLMKIRVVNENLVISVIDNGIGIGQANPEELFQMFVRASERSVSGGIGLYLSRRATEKLGGEIQLRTTTEGYTEFYVTFPLENQFEGAAVEETQLVNKV
jgi:signal transduction histidine kinase